MRNRNTSASFILLGFTFDGDIQAALFAWFLLVYIIALLGNITVIALITVTTKLHTPMYFFLLVLSFHDIVSVTVTVPRMLKDLLVQKKHIAFSECLIQVFVILLVSFTDVLILTAMCYDRYVAICQPLNYTVLMNRRFCIQVVSLSWLGGAVLSFVNTFLLSRLSFCGANIIENLLCEVPALLKLSCANTLPNEIVLFTLAGGVALVTFVIICLSYVHIIRIILKIPSSGGKKKVFSTCSAHLMVVFLFFGTGAFTHLKPSSASMRLDKLASLFYTVFAPVLNPIIYCLRNEEVKEAFKKATHCN
ncbi:olfactory receptor 4E2-like [Lissotriton helveticus]